MGGQTIGLAKYGFNRNRPGVAGDKSLLLVPCRNGAALFGIDGIELLADVRALVDRFRVGIAQQELRAAVLIAKRRFKRVVVGVANRAIRGILAVVRACPDARAKAALSGA